MMHSTSDILISFEQYALSPTQHAGRLRTLLEEEQAEFLECVAATEHLDLNCRGYRFSLVMLRNSGVLIPYLANPLRSSFAPALRLTKLMMLLDVGFSHELLDSLGSSLPELQAVECKLRVLDLVLESGAQPSSLRQISKLAAEDGRLRTRYIQLLTRQKVESQMIHALYDQSDARGRADLVETLDSEYLPKAEALFQKAFADGNNRAAANACLAAYRAQDERCFAWLAEMIGSNQPHPFRISAAWAMAQARDPRFSHCLLNASRSGAGGAQGTTDGKMRASALRALTCLFRPDNYELDPEVKLQRAFELPFFAQPDENTARTIYVLADGHLPAATDWFLYSGSLPILKYSVQDPPSRDTAVRVACSATASSSVGWESGECSSFRVDRVATFGSETSLARAAKSLLPDWPQCSERIIVLMIDPSLPMDLDRAAFEQLCRDAGCDLILMESPANLAIEHWSRFTNSLRNGFRIRFQAPLANLNLRLRRIAGSDMYLSEKLAW